jgi:hypothetical protein
MFSILQVSFKVAATSIKPLESCLFLVLTYSSRFSADWSSMKLPRKSDTSQRMLVLESAGHLGVILMYLIASVS